MKFGLAVALVAAMSSCCCRDRDEVWDDTRTAGRHMARGVRSLGGKHGDSRQVRCRDDFICYNDDFCVEEDLGFIPLDDYEMNDNIAMNDGYYTGKIQAAELPGIEGFKDPNSIPGLYGIFEPIHFPYNSSLVKGSENRDTLRGIATYMKQNPKVYLFVEGHCDERGAEAYNLALGARRSNTVRNELTRQGANPDRIFTVSYGKERPLDSGHTEESWTKNRRAEFKIYKQQ